jgi:hypothetical protein
MQTQVVEVTGAYIHGLKYPRVRTYAGCRRNMCAQIVQVVGIGLYNNNRGAQL